jgi:DNA-binding response OmpR family regulator
MNKRIMIVDDEPDVLKSLKIVFERQKYDVTTVESGAACISEIERGFQGVILMDIMMPDMDGWETIKEIVDRGLVKNIVIEIITGKGTRNHEKMSTLGSYVYDYLSKPLDINQLISSVNKCNALLSARSN